MPAGSGKTSLERVQIGVRLEKRMVQVLKGLAEFEGLSLGELLEKIVLHSFDPVPGQEGEANASPHGRKALAAIADLRRVYGMDYDVHATRHFENDGQASADRER
jgi:predicted DNA-binding ribbon-helix-helix protein